jgi:recombination associated protein RdgC
MFFKNLLPYRLTQAIDLSPELLEKAMAEKQARPCASQELTTYGFTAPFSKGEDAPLVHVSGDFLLIATRKEERILPGSVVRDALKEKVEEIESEQMRKVYKKERDQLKDDIIQAFLPRAFVRRASTFAAIDVKQGVVLVNSASPARAEDLLSTLREVLGSLPIRPMTVKVSPVATMTEWVQTQKPADDFFVLDNCELRDTHEDGGLVRCKRQDLTGDEVKLHLSTGKVVTQMSIAWQDKLSFVLDDRLVIKGLKFEDILHDQAAQDGGEDAMGQFDASFTLMMLTFAQFLPALTEALGGEEIPGGLEEPVAAPGDDTLLPDAITYVRTTLNASVSGVQRHFSIGYNRAARIVDQLQARGVISPPGQTGTRTVLK